MAGNPLLWSTTAADNDDADGAVNFLEGQLPGTVNGSGRGLMAGIASWLKDRSGQLTSGGSSNAYTITSNIAYASLTNGLEISFRANHSNTGAATLTLNALTVKDIRIVATGGNTALTANMIRSGGQYTVVYDSGLDAFVLKNPAFWPSTGNLAVTGTHTITSTSNVALVVTPTGTNNALQVDNSTSSAATGVKITSKAEAAGVAIAAISSGTNEGLTIDAKGSGSIQIGTVSTGKVVIRGTATNDSAASGFVGEILESEVLTASAVTLTSGAAKTITSITLTPGDWDVWGNVVFNGANTTTISQLAAAVHTNTNEFPTAPNKGAYSQFALPFTAASGSDPENAIQAGCRRYSVASNTDVFLIGFAVFATSTMAAYGYLGARRRR